MTSLQTNPELCVILVTCPSEKAQPIASALVERHVAACVNVTGPVASTYFWDGSLCTDEERLLIIKSNRGHLESLFATVKELHPYSVPEFVILPAVAASYDYASWVTKTLTQG